jgi:hypothetical protein
MPESSRMTARISMFERNSHLQSSMMRRFGTVVVGERVSSAQFVGVAARSREVKSRLTKWWGVALTALYYAC